jgi:hypothetical protein
VIFVNVVADSFVAGPAALDFVTGSTITDGRWATGY